MSAGKQCDNCQRWDNGFGWYHVERDGPHAYGASDFCSLKCIKEWATVIESRRTSAHPGTSAEGKK